MPLYSSATVAIALGASPKWLDNLLSHNDVSGVSGGRQGVARRFSGDAVVHIALARELSRSLQVPAPASLAIAARLLAGRVETSASRSVADDEPDRSADDAFGRHLRVTVDHAALRRAVLERLAHAVEVAPVPARGRPRRRRAMVLPGAVHSAAKDSAP